MKDAKDPKKEPKKQAKIDEHAKMNRLIEQEKTRAEMGIEITKDKELSNLVGDRLAKKNYFPPC